MSISFLETLRKNKFFNGGETINPVKTFRPEPWFVDTVKAYAVANGLATPANNEYNFSNALHQLVRDLKNKAAEVDKANKDLAIYRGYMEKLAKETKPFRCEPMNETITVLDCYQCQSVTRKDPTKAPPDVVQCPRMKAS